MFPLSSILSPMPRLKILDVGAMSLGEGTEPYAALLKAAPCAVIGFEPVETELAKLKAIDKSGATFLPYYVGDGTPQVFHECNYPMTSSLLEPNSALLAKFQNLEELTRVVKRTPVETKRLDDMREVAGTDLLKIDVQGGELMVLHGAVETLKSVLVVHTEVEFVPMYKDQPLFGDIDEFLRAQGFLLHRLGAAGRMLKPVVVNSDVNAMGSQLLWADAIFLRDFMSFDRLAPAALLKLAVILHANYRSFDFAAHALEWHDRQTGSRLQPAYIEALIAPKER